MASEERDVVERFFEWMGDERREDIGDLFAADATITLPGAEFQGPDAPGEFLGFLAPRYEWAEKKFDEWIESDNRVVSIGTLYGVDTDGDEFDDVRYIDVYEIENGKITRLDIWNDLAIEGVVD